MRVWQLTKVVLLLGAKSIARVLLYRLGIQFGFNPVKRLKAELSVEPCVGKIDADAVKQVLNVQALNADGMAELKSNPNWRQGLSYYGWAPFSIDRGEPPDWFLDPFLNSRVEQRELPWWQIPDFSESGRDIKNIWELSRFDWVLGFAQAAIIESSSAAVSFGTSSHVNESEEAVSSSLCRLNAWLLDWSKHNPPYYGPNWKCGQEASIRVLHLVLAAMLLKQTHKPEPALLSFIEAHLKRIRPTLMYALGQDNNHGTSEAAALYVGGEFLAINNVRVGESYARVGSEYLNERANRLILKDGSFSQYSCTYHRLMLETMSLCEVWARSRDSKVFSKSAFERLALATQWLVVMVDPESGDAPNLGANDGAHLLPLTAADYRDFRPSIELAAILFQRHSVFDDENSRAHIRWLGLERERMQLRGGAKPNKIAADDFKQLVHLSEGGYVLLKSTETKVLFSYPRFKFRPSQSDPMHLDVWTRGINVLRDAGSYSYNAEAKQLAYFNGMAGHNTIEFDRRDAMPKLSRFLYGEWLQSTQVRTASTIDEDGCTEQSAEAQYVDWLGATHHRAVSLQGNVIQIVDSCSGYERSAVMRWRLAPSNWVVKGNEAYSDLASIRIDANQESRRLELVEGWESRYYMQKNALPVLEVEFASLNIKESLTITTTITL
jgi:hypothetical protein